MWFRDAVFDVCAVFGLDIVRVKCVWCEVYDASLLSEFDNCLFAEVFEAVRDVVVDAFCFNVVRDDALWLFVVVEEVEECDERECDEHAYDDEDGELCFSCLWRVHFILSFVVMSFQCVSSPVVGRTGVAVNVPNWRLNCFAVCPMMRYSVGVSPAFAGVVEFAHIVLLRFSNAPHTFVFGAAPR